MKQMNKWFYAFIATAVVLLGAVIALIAVGANSNNTDAPDLSDGEETGVYYYDVADGEVVLSLSSGKNFSIAGPGINKSGGYTLEGSEIVFDFVRDDDGTAPGTYVDGVITLVYEGATMKFIPKVNYSVKFDTDGGSSVAALNVLNGKTASKPADPTKAGYAFIGWYADSEFTTPYDFSTMTVGADTTVYARWAELVVGQNEYVADFVLGYDGAPEYEQLTTIGGKLYGVKTPAREGYTFGGWYISMYEDGDKLSYAYTEDTVLEANTTLYAVWYDNASTKLNAPKVSVNGSTVKWDKVDSAASYKIVIKDASGAVVEPEHTVGTTNYSFDFSLLPAGDYTVEVIAVASNADKNSVAAVRYFKNKAMGRVSKFQVVDGVLVYNAVEGAEKYLVTVECGNAGHNHTLFDNGNSTNYNFSNCPMAEGGIKFTVTAVANGYASTTSETFVYNRVLASVGSVIYDAEKDAFVWNEVANATKYSVSVVVGENTYTFDNGTKTSFSVAGYTGEITVKVTPVTEGYNSPAAAEAVCTKTAPAVPGGLTVNGMTLTWNVVEGATGYEVKIGTVSKTVETNSLDLADTSLGLSVGTTYSVQVKAIKNNDSSAYSEPVSVGYRVMNPALTYANKTVYWQPVAGVVEFEVRINGGAPVRVSGVNFAEVTLTKAGVNTIEVRYCEYGGSNWASVEVVAYEVSYNTRSLGGIFTEYLAIGDALTPPVEDTDFYVNGYAFAGWYNAPAAAAGNGKEYTYPVFVGNGDTVLYANWTPKSYKVQFQVDGFDIGNITQGDENDVTYTKDYVLPVPESTNALYGTFVGWFTGPAGSGDQLTDAEGNCVTGYPFYRDTIAYPYFETGILSFIQRSDGTYAVKMGPSFASVSNVTVPYTYDGVPVTAILENAFANSKTLETINIPSNIKLVGTGAFSGCTALKAINSYEVEGNYDVYYSTYDGALLMHDMGTVYLEVFPRAKTGVYTVPENVDVIRDKAFQYSYIDKVIISKGVSLVKVNAFYNCKAITAVEFEGDRTSTVTIEDGAFRGCATLKTLKLPAKLAEMNYVEVLRYITNLQTIEVEADGLFYGSVNGMLTNDEKDTILYAPTSVSGTVTIPQGIQHIGPVAFAGIKGITKVVIPTYVMTVGNGAFNACAALTEVEVESGRNNDLEIGEYAFAYCSKLKNVTFGTNADYEGGTDRGAVTIGQYAFAPTADGAKFNTNLQKVTFTNGIKIALIGEGAFANQTSLTNIVGFNDENVVVAEIGAGAFANNTLLHTIVIPASTRKIGAYAFEGCVSVTRVTFADGGNSVEFGEGVFANCESLYEVYLPATVSYFDGTAFAGCPSLAKIIVDADNPYYYTDDNGVLYNKAVTELIFYPKTLPVDKDTLDALPWDTITKIGDSVFSYNTGLTSFEVKKGVTVIGQAAFADCTNLTTVTFEADGTTLVVGNKAFYNCQKIETISLPAYTTEIGDSAFENAQFTSFVIPDAVTYIGFAAFRGANKLAAINIPAKVEYIGDAAFANCSKLATVTFAESETLVSIGTLGAEVETNGVFYGTALTAFDTKGRALLVGNYAFYKVSTLASVSFGTGLDSIGAYAFQNSGITSVTIPNTVVFIGDYAFGGSSAVSALSNIIFEMGGTAELNIGVSAFAYTNITSITFPNRVNDMYTTTTINSVEIKEYSKLFDGVKALAAINVEDGSARYASIDGVLYEKNERGVITNLLYCPSDNPGKTVTVGEDSYDNAILVPNTVELVENGSFITINKLTTIIFEELPADDPNYGKPVLRLGNCKSDSEWVDGGGIYAVIGGIANTKDSSWLKSGKSQSTNTITKVQLPSHLGYLGAYSIGATKSAVDLTFNPASTDITIGRNAFKYTSVKKIDVPAVSHVGTYAFAYSKTIESIEFGANSTFTMLGNWSVAGVLITEFEVPACVEVIGNGAFDGCSKLESVSFAEKCRVGEINEKAFNGCSSLVNIDFTNATRLTYMGIQAFQGCAALTSFTFPDSITSIGSKEFFYNCSALKVITLSKNISVNMIEINDPTSPQSLFKGLDALEEVKINGNNPELCVVDGVLYDKAQTILYVFPHAKSSEDFEIPSTVKRIANYAFYKFTGESIELPEGLESIGALAFSGSTNLKSVTIPASVRELGNAAFSSGSVLVDVIFDDIDNSQLVKIGNQVFRGSKKINTVVLPDSLEEMGTACFENCSALTSIILPAALKSIPDTTFVGATKLGSVVIQQKIETIGKNAFANTSYANKVLTEITIPATVVSIGDSAFINMSGLTSVVFDGDSNLETLGTSVFNGCSGITEMILPSSLKTMGTKVFYANTGLKTLIMAGSLENLPTNTFTGCIALETLVLPEKLGAIDAGAFTWVDGGKLAGVIPGATALKEIVIPATVTSIGKNAFDGCTALETVIFANGSVLESLGTSETEGDDIFKDTNLKHIDLPGNLKFIGAYTFANMDIDDVVLPSSMTTIGNYAFYNCDGLTNVAIYGNTTYIGDYAFYDCDGLITAEVSSGLEYFGTLAFGACDKLESGFIPDSVITMNGNPYAGCPLITNFPISEDNQSFYIDADGIVYDSEDKYTLVYVPSTITGEFVIDEGTYEIATGAFSNSQITSIVIPRRLGKISEFAFMNSKKLETVVIEDGIRIIGAYAFYGCTALTSINIPSSIKEIGEYAFAECTALEVDIVLPEGFKNETGALAKYTFANSGILSVVIPSTITDISEEGVFSGCKKLATVTFAGEKLNCTGIGSYFFKDCESLVEIFIPRGAGDVFKESGVSVFEGCKSLTKVTIYYAESTTGSLAMAGVKDPTATNMFNGCTNLVELVIYEIPMINVGTARNPKYEEGDPVLSGMNYVGEYFFKDCTSLTTVTVKKGSTIHETAFDGCGEVEIVEPGASSGDDSGSGTLPTPNPGLPGGKVPLP